MRVRRHELVRAVEFRLHMVEAMIELSHSDLTNVTGGITWERYQEHAVASSEAFAKRALPRSNNNEYHQADAFDRRYGQWVDAWGKYHR